MRLLSTPAGFRGELIRPGDVAYDEARRLWNGAIDRHPSLIARCTSTGDVAVVLAHALQAGTPVTIRGGGHNVGGWALADGAMAIDFSLMRCVRVDSRRRRAWVQPGALWGDFDSATQPFGLAAPAGVVTHTGVAGLTLGGGFGWLSRRFGLVSDNLIAAELLLASGERVRASETDHQDLFWAIRGGGGNFGIVTEFEFRLHDSGTEVLAGPIFHTADRAREVLHFYRDFISDAPDELSVYVNLRTAPGLDWIPADLRGKAVVMLVPFYSGNLGEGNGSCARCAASARPRPTSSSASRTWRSRPCLTPPCATAGATTGSPTISRRSPMPSSTSWLSMPGGSRPPPPTLCCFTSADR
jgi:FAD/FMN-containing dehydrogenase